MRPTGKYLWVPVSIALMVLLCPIEGDAQSASSNMTREKQIAITIDDLPLNGPNIGIARLRPMTASLLSALEQNKIPAVGFVNESLLYVPGETEARIALLKEWIVAGVELGNHTFSHLRFADVSLADYEDDFIQGETVTRGLLKESGRNERFFRHPYLRMGTTPELEKSFEAFIAERGYRIAPVTLDSMDWMFLAAYSAAQKRNDPEMKRKVSAEYLKFAEIKIEFAEKVSAQLFGRQIRQILLLHANELNADNLDDLAQVFRKHGYRFISLEQALQDPAYQFPERYKATSDWFDHWSFSKGVVFDSPMPPDFIQKAYSTGGQ